MHGYIMKRVKSTKTNKMLWQNGLPMQYNKHCLHINCVYDLSARSVNSNFIFAYFFSSWFFIAKTEAIVWVRKISTVEMRCENEWTHTHTHRYTECMRKSVQSFMADNQQQRQELNCTILENYNRFCFKSILLTSFTYSL